MADQAFAPGTFFGASAALTTATTLITEFEEFSWSGMERNAVETTHLGSTNGHKTYIPGDIIDNGELTITGKYSTQLNYETLFRSTGKCDTLTVTFPKRAVSCGASLPTTAATAAWSVVLTKFEPMFTNDEVMKARFTFKVTGSATLTAAVA
jgi:hypothetical protein